MSELYVLVEDDTVDLFKDELECVVVSDSMVFVPVNVYKYITRVEAKKQKQNPQLIFNTTVSVASTMTSFESKRITRQSKIRAQQGG